MDSHVHTLEERFQSFLESESLVSRGENIALAISGGPDSMVMLHLFLAVRKSLGVTLCVVHVNHQLRGRESEDDEAFVARVAGQLELPAYVERVNTLDFQHGNKLSKQEAARILRYEVFNRARKKLGAARVATAHTATDNAETVLLNILRGTGIRGLSGIPLQRDGGGIIRPLLFAFREEVEQYASRLAIEYRRDSSNLLISSTRNLLRHEIIPRLREQVNPDVTGALLRISRTMRDLVSRIDAEIMVDSERIVRSDGGRRVLIDLKELEIAPPFLQDEYLLLALKLAGGPVSTEKVLQLRDLREGQSGRRHDLSRGLIASRDHDVLILGQPEPRRDFAYKVELGSTYDFDRFSFSAKPLASKPQALPESRDREIIDAAALGTSLVLRSWKEGDWFMPLGMQNKKKLSDFFADQKISHEGRLLIPILESDGSIVWICGLRLDDRAKVTPETTGWVELSYHYHC
jgi:tRNA(Ile)-lysidine synthase